MQIYINMRVFLSGSSSFDLIGRANGLTPEITKIQWLRNIIM